MATNADLQFTNSSANAANTLPTLAGYTQPSLQPYNADTAMYPAINSLAAAAAAYYNASLPASGSQYQQLPGLWPLAGSEPSVTQNVHSNSTAGAGTNGPASTGAGSNNAPNASPNNGAGVNVNANSNSLLYLHGPSAWNPYYAQRSIVNYAAEYSANRRKNATRETTSTLKAWLQEHIKNPYPSKGEKIMLAIITKMTLTQVSTWFANARRRLKKENKMQWSPRQSNEDDDSQPPPPPPAQAAQPEAKQVKLDSASVSFSANVKPASSKLATCKDGAEASCADVNGLSKIWSLAQAASDAKDTQSQLLGFSAANFQAGFSSSSRDALHSLQSLSFGSLPNSSSWSCAMQTAMNASGEGNFGMFKLD